MSLSLSLLQYARHCCTALIVRVHIYIYNAQYLGWVWVWVWVWVCRCCSMRGIVALPVLFEKDLTRILTDVQAAVAGDAAPLKVSLYACVYARIYACKWVCTYSDVQAAIVWNSFNIYTPAHHICIVSTYTHVQTHTHTHTHTHTDVHVPFHNRFHQSIKPYTHILIKPLPLSTYTHTHTYIHIQVFTVLLTVASIGQSDPRPFSTNTITLTLATNLPLVRMSAISIYPLEGASIDTSIEPGYNSETNRVISLSGALNSTFAAKVCAEEADVCEQTGIYIYTCMYVCVYMYVYIYIYIYIYEQHIRSETVRWRGGGHQKGIYMFIYIHVYIHTYIHTYIGLWEWRPETITIFMYIAEQMLPGPMYVVSWKVHTYTYIHTYIHTHRSRGMASWNPNHHHVHRRADGARTNVCRLMESAQSWPWAAGSSCSGWGWCGWVQVWCGKGAILFLCYVDRVLGTHMASCRFSLYALSYHQYVHICTYTHVHTHTEVLDVLLTVLPIGQYEPRSYLHTHTHTHTNSSSKIWPPFCRTSPARWQGTQQCYTYTARGGLSKVLVRARHIRITTTF